jgi:superfamily I DNA/RNA helicase
MRTNRQIVQYLAVVYRCAVMPNVNWPAAHVQQHIDTLLLKCFDLQRQEDMLEVLQLAEDHIIQKKCLTSFRKHPEAVVRLIGEELVRCDSIGDFLLFLLGAMARTTADITVISAHGCKGLTFNKAVVVVDPGGYQVTSHNPDALNLLYVALTRGRTELFVVTLGRCNTYSAIAKFTGYAV